MSRDTYIDRSRRPHNYRDIVRCFYTLFNYSFIYSALYLRIKMIIYINNHKNNMNMTKEEVLLFIENNKSKAGEFVSFPKAVTESLVRWLQREYVVDTERLRIKIPS